MSRLNPNQQVTIRMPLARAIELRYVLPLVAEMCLHQGTEGKVVAKRLNEVLADVDSALPAGVVVDENTINELRMDVHDVLGAEQGDEG